MPAYLTLSLYLHNDHRNVLLVYYKFKYKQDLHHILRTNEDYINYKVLKRSVSKPGLLIWLNDSIEIER